MYGARQGAARPKHRRNMLKTRTPVRDAVEAKAQTAVAALAPDVPDIVADAAASVVDKPLGKGPVIGMSATLLVLRVAIAACCMYECVATGLFTNEPVAVWTTMYSLAGAMSIAMGIATIVDTKCTRRQSAVATVKSRSIGLYAVCLVDAVAFLFLAAMIIIYNDQYNGDTPFSGSTRNSNPRDRLSAWRTIHSTGLTFNTFSAAALIYTITMAAHD